MVHTQREMLDHCYTLLNAELTWLERTIHRLHTRFYAL